MKKKIFYAEFAYLAGILSTAIGNSFITRADFGVSMVVVPSYILHLKISQILPFYSFGMSNYIFQALVILLTAIITKKFKISYLLSFMTAFLFGLTLDAVLVPITLIPSGHIAVRILLMAVGMIFVSFGVGILFHTYLPPESYELFVKEVSAKSGISIGKLKTAYDLSSLALAIILSFALFGGIRLDAIGIGTVACALLNGTLIGTSAKILGRHFEFKALFKLSEHIQ